MKKSVFFLLLISLVVCVACTERIRLNPGLNIIIKGGKYGIATDAVGESKEEIILEPEYIGLKVINPGVPFYLDYPYFIVIHPDSTQTLYKSSSNSVDSLYHGNNIVNIENEGVHYYLDYAPEGIYYVYLGNQAEYSGPYDKIYTDQSVMVCEKNGKTSFIWQRGAHPMLPPQEDVYFIYASGTGGSSFYLISYDGGQTYRVYEVYFDSDPDSFRALGTLSGEDVRFMKDYADYKAGSNDQYMAWSYKSIPNDPLLLRICDAFNFDCYQSWWSARRRW